MRHRKRLLAILILIPFTLGCSTTPDMSREDVLTQIELNTANFTTPTLALFDFEQDEANKLKGEVSKAYTEISRLIEPGGTDLNRFAMLVIRRLDEDDRKEAIAAWSLIRIFAGQHLQLELSMDILDAALSVSIGMINGIDAYIELIRAGPEEDGGEA